MKTHSAEKRFSFHEGVSYSSVVASNIEDRGMSDLSQRIRQVAFRCPVDLLAKVDSLAEYGGYSRNELMIEMLRVGAEEVAKQIDLKAYKVIEPRYQKLREKYFKETKITLRGQK